MPRAIKARKVVVRWEQINDRIKGMVAQVKTDEDAADHWLSAEAEIERFLDAAVSRSAEIPSGSALGEACLWLVVLLAADPNGDGIELCGELLASSAAVSLLPLEPRVRSFLQAATTELERQAQPDVRMPIETDLF